MRVDILTLFPGLFEGFLQDAVINRAQQKGLLLVTLHQLRNWTHDKHQTVDDYPFGGGAGMVLKPEPIHEAFSELLKDRTSKPTTIYFSPSGKLLNQEPRTTIAAA